MMLHTQEVLLHMRTDSDMFFVCGMEILVAEVYV